MSDDFWAPTDMKPKCLPTYVVVDASGSMAPHEQNLNQTLTKLHSTLAMSKRVSEFAHISVIAFSTDAHLVIPMTDLQDVPALPDIVCDGLTDYGKVFALIRERIAIDIDALKAADRAVLRPAVFFFTDGVPMDPAWEQSFQRLVDKSWSRRPHVITYGFGQADPTVLSKISTKAAFVSDGTDQQTALADAISGLLNTLVASARSENLQIPAQMEGYISITPEYMD